MEHPQADWDCLPDEIKVWFHLPWSLDSLQKEEKPYVGPRTGKDFSLLTAAQYCHMPPRQPCNERAHYGE